MYEFEGMPYAWLSFAEAVLIDKQGNANPVTTEDVAVITAALTADGTTLRENSLSGDVKIYREQEASYHAYEGVKLVQKERSLYLVFGVAREKLMRKAGVTIPRSLPPLPTV